jgi:hypothetical protein
MLDYDLSNEQLLSKYNEFLNTKKIESSIKNFPRFSRLTKLCFLTFIEKYANVQIDDMENTALLLVDENGSFEANVDYYEDYLDSGEKLARGNLFIYTLATSPLAQLAIYLNVNGALQYLQSSSDNKSFARKQAKIMIDNKNAKTVLVFYKEKNQFL